MTGTFRVQLYNRNTHGGDFVCIDLSCNISFNTLIIRQYFNIIIEYLIDTYPGSSRLLPMELQTDDVEEVSIPVEADLRASYGVGKDDWYEKEDGYDRPSVIRYERRMRIASELAEKTGLTAEGVYRILLVGKEMDWVDRENNELWIYLYNLIPEP